MSANKGKRVHPLQDLKKLPLKALIIVAHPDDESLFVGGTITEFKRWRWNVLCVTHCEEPRNRRRRRELLRACRSYTRGGSRVKPFMLSIVKRDGRLPKSEIREGIEDFIKTAGPFDIFFTHGKEGEYGHGTHKLIQRIVSGLKLTNVFYFSAQRRARAQKVRLSPRSRRIKKQALDIYLTGSQRTNLSRLKGVVARAVESDAEWFIYKD